MKNIALLVLAMFIISCNKNNEKASLVKTRYEFPPKTNKY